jgi:ATP adenylyltransferase
VKQLWAPWRLEYIKSADEEPGCVFCMAVAGDDEEHVVPRWAGDTNFMPVLADVKVLPEHLDETRRRLAEAWPLS